MSKRQRAAWALERSGAGRLIRRLPVWQGVLVLNYHRIGDGSRSLLDRNLWSATPEELDDQIGFLAGQFELVGPDDFSPELTNGRGRRVMLTFDDGYRDNYEVARPILLAHRVRATFFIATGFIDRPHTGWWDEVAWLVRTSGRSVIPRSEWLDRSLALNGDDREEPIRALLAVCKAIPSRQVEDFLDWLAEAAGAERRPDDEAVGEWMTWDMVRELHRDGMWIAGHTVSHPVLSRMSAQDQRAEISGCLDRLEEQLGLRPDVFSYPVGLPSSFTPDTREQARAAGVRLAFSNYGGYTRRGHTDPLDVPRTTAGLREGPDLFRALTAAPQVFATW